MAGIKQPILDILAKLATLAVKNRDGEDTLLYSRVYNNQIKNEIEGKGYAFAKPAAFIEIMNPSEWQIMSQGYRNSDLVFRIHACHEYLNGEGTLEQDLEIFDLRDAIIELLSFFTPTGCGPMMAMAEVQEYDHINVYEYVIDFVCNFTDDVARKKYTIKQPPTDVEFQVSTINQTQQTIYTVQQGKAYSTAYTASDPAGERTFLVLDQNGNKIIGANLIAVFKEIKMLKPVQWIWDNTTSNLTLLVDENGPIFLSPGESAFVIYQQNIY